MGTRSEVTKTLVLKWLYKEITDVQVYGTPWSTGTRSYV